VVASARSTTSQTASGSASTSCRRATCRASYGTRSPDATILYDLTFRLALRQETARTGLADLVALERTLNADTDLIWRELHEWHKPRTIGAVDEAIDRVSHLLGDRARLFGNLPRLNELLKLIQLHLLRLDDPNNYARILRENHLAHAGSPPPRRRHDGAGLRFTS
jgi:hypothetical protein